MDDDKVDGLGRKWQELVQEPSDEHPKALVKCPYCGESLNRREESFIIIPNGLSRRYAHLDCIKALEASGQNSDALDRLEFWDYVANNIENYSYAMISSQTDTFTDPSGPYKYTWSGMLKTLKYIKEIKGMDLQKGHGGIGIIPYMYRDAFDYYHELYQIRQKQRNSKEDIPLQPRTREVKIKSQQVIPKKTYDLDYFFALDEEYTGEGDRNGAF